MDIFQVPVLLVAPFVLLAYVCRLAMLSFRTNRPVIVLLHISLAVSVAWAAYRAFLGVALFGDVAAVVGAGCWILISYGSWRHGVPEHFQSRPVDLDTESWIRVTGGKK